MFDKTVNQMEILHFINTLIDNEYKLEQNELRTFSFNEIVELLGMLLIRVESREIELKSLIDTLEHKVADRTQDLADKNKTLEDALQKVKLLSGLVPICANCKKIRDDDGFWQQIESYISDHSEATFTHGICPDCRKELYPELYD